MDFKGKAGSSQVDEKEQICGGQFLLGCPETRDAEGSLRTELAGSSLPATLRSRHTKVEDRSLPFRRFFLI